MNTSNFKLIFLGQSVFKYQVPLEINHIINSIYENKYSELEPANKQLVGKIEKEHSLFFNGEDSEKMIRHNHLPKNILMWFESMFKHYLKFNRIKGYKLHFNSVWVNQMFEHEYNPVHVHQGTLYTGLSSVMILKLPESFGVEYSAAAAPQEAQEMKSSRSRGARRADSRCLKMTDNSNSTRVDLDYRVPGRTIVHST